MPGLSKHLVKELNVGTALIMILYYCILTPYFNLKDILRATWVASFTFISRVNLKKHLKNVLNPK